MAHGSCRSSWSCRWANVPTKLVLQRGLRRGFLRGFLRVGCSPFFWPPTCPCNLQMLRHLEPPRRAKAAHILRGFFYIALWGSPCGSPLQRTKRVPKDFMLWLFENGSLGFNFLRSGSSIGSSEGSTATKQRAAKGGFHNWGILFFLSGCSLPPKNREQNVGLRNTESMARVPNSSCLALISHTVMGIRARFIWFRF